MLPTLYIYQPHIPGVTDPADPANGLSGIEADLQAFSLEIGNLHHQPLWAPDKTDYDVDRHKTLLAQSDYLVLLAPEATRNLPASAWDLQGVARRRPLHAGRPPKCIYYCDLLYSFGLDRDLPLSEDATPAKASSFELWLKRIRTELAAVAPEMRIESWYPRKHGRPLMPQSLRPYRSLNRRLRFVLIATSTSIS